MDYGVRHAKPRLNGIGQANPLVCMAKTDFSFDEGQSNIWKNLSLLSYVKLWGFKYLQS